MRLAVLGTGKIVQEALPVLEGLGIQPHAILGTERSRERAEALAARYRIPRRCFRYEEVLESGADTIYVALPNSLHYAYARRALEGGLHVLVEKPAVTALAQLRELRRLAAGRRLVLAEAMTLHHLPAVLALQEQMARLGPLRLAGLNFSQYSSRYDTFLEGKTAPAFDPAMAGGALMDLNVYNIHLAAALFGSPRQIRYCANLQRGVDTSGVLTLDYGGMKAVCVAAKDCQGANTSFIQGELGRLELTEPVSSLTGWELVLRTGERERFETVPRSHRMSCEFAAFRRMIDEKDLDRAEELLDLSEIAVAILEEARAQITG